MSDHPPYHTTEAAETKQKIGFFADARQWIQIPPPHRLREQSIRTQLTARASAVGDGPLGWPPEALFNRIIFPARVPLPPDTLLGQRETRGEALVLVRSRRRADGETGGDASLQLPVRAAHRP